MAQINIPKIPSIPVSTTPSHPAHDRKEYHNPIGVQMTRAEIARQAWLDK